MSGRAKLAVALVMVCTALGCAAVRGAGGGGGAGEVSGKGGAAGAGGGRGLASVPPSAPELMNPCGESPEAAAAGRKLFLRHCAECHGEDGRGSRRAPSLDSRRLRQASAGALFWFLTNGRLVAGMPSWSRLPAARRWQIIAYLQERSAAGRSESRD